METEDEATEGEGDTPQTLPVRPAPPTPPAPVNNTEDTPVGGGGMNTSSTMPRTIPPANTGKSVNRKKNQKRVPRVR